MPSNCSVYGCNNRKEKKTETEIRYFRFPKENDVKKHWVYLCRRSDYINTEHALICSQHFTKEDYVDDMKSRLLGIPSPRNRRLLKKDAVPSLFLYKGIGTTDDVSERADRSSKRESKRKLEDMLSNIDNYSIETSASKSTQSDEIAELKVENSRISKERDELLQRVSDLDSLSKEKDKKIRDLENTINCLQMEKDKNDSHKHIVENHIKLHEKIEELFKHLFSKTQISVIINKRSPKVWTQEDISEALTLRSLSPRMYEYLRVVKHYPLPSISTLNDKAKNFYCEPGVLSSVISLLKSKSETMNEPEKLTVISFDEMEIASNWSYDKGADRLYKPHKKVQVVMLRGLVGSWKQPIYYDFDKHYMYNILLDIIEKVEHAGYYVVAIVHDLGPCNLRVWKDFGIDPENTEKFSFKNPNADREIFVFADVPHLIKLVRNNFIKFGFHLDNGDLISHECIEEMLSKSKTEYGLAYKLNEVHLNVSNLQKQRVQFATQLLSKSCADSISYLGEKGLLVSKGWRETADFIYLVNNWFDIMNTNRMFDEKVKSRNAFGTDLNNQTAILQKMIHTIKTMKVAGKKYLYPFQKGIILSCQSLIGLYRMVKELYDVQFIMTRRLNQDGLEHFFGIIRQMNGCYDHPDAVNFKYRFKKYLLGRQVVLLSNKTNSSASDENSSCISTELCSNNTPSESKILKENRLSVELCLTTLLFKDMEFYVDSGNEDIENTLLMSTDEVIEEESLRYIGGYIVRKFCKEYPHLGIKAINDISSNHTWIDKVNRGDLYVPTDQFFSQLIKMRAIFKAINGESLKEGEKCFENMAKEFKYHVDDVPWNVLYFFAKISVFFRIRYLNKRISINKRKNDNRQTMKKLAKLNA